MKLHERYVIVKQQKRELDSLVFDYLFDDSRDLTQGERIRIISEIFSDLIASEAKYMIRAERHGDENKKGDEA